MGTTGTGVLDEHFHALSSGDLGFMHSHGDIKKKHLHFYRRYFFKTETTNKAMEGI